MGGDVVAIEHNTGLM